MQEYTFTDNKRLTVINLFGAAGTGKSTIMGYTYGKLKERGYNAEMASEWIKEGGIYEARKNVFLEQDYILAKQHRKLRRLVGQVDIAVTDCPLMLGLIYKPDWYPKSFDQYVIDIFNSYNNINFFLHRNSFEYTERGRVHTEQQSIDKEVELQQLLLKHNINYIDIDNIRECGNVVAAVIAEETINRQTEQKEQQLLANIEYDTEKF
jgi:GTPase SAR1 family protein